MSRVAMTWPQYRRRECAIDGVAVRLPPMQCDLLLALLLSPPDRFVGYAAIVEVLWPDPDRQPLDTRQIIGVDVCRMRRTGLPIETDWGIGLRIPAAARGGPRAMPCHALDMIGGRARFRRRLREQSPAAAFDFGLLPRLQAAGR